ncbi:hypothetical protein BO70DRAFT_397426 [Aspergillus heteromorphus CBS 117.55]|uniref:Uncharacterized protein n=1 Tax=Aspergillus heteromorphus CBS 117.55 TaxID=1448321 RepID=A0A317W5A3_9EURO|nr:uncharacterized protein BO70DRAFT_397426 [Aspergillus heteromorphus CBS 117.55]PWY79320.1 hypothetical protein BO70DRAFT_397426 [Aspergillus heteromorphus CBS 117.55]
MAELKAKLILVTYREPGTHDDDIRVFSLHDDTTIPSAIAYQPDGRFTIGRQAMQEHNCIFWMKLLLSNHQILSDYNNTSLTEIVRREWVRLPENKKDVSTVVADFSRSLLDSLRTTLHQIPYLTDPPTVYYFTIPATWSESARMDMKKAVQLAGFEKRSVHH